MDIIKRLNSVNTLNDYIELTQDLAHSISENVTMAVNMTSVLALNKVRCYEIEYFNKCDGRGAAFVLFERLLKSPLHGTWGLLGPDLIALIRYWLDAVRKHLISHHIHWWSFLKYLLQFIKLIYKNEQSLNNTLVEYTAECLLDLAINCKTDTQQQYEILHTLNLYCQKADKELRLKYQPDFDHYLLRLSTVLATAPHAPTQLAILETLMRWLQPRKDRATRKTAADKWLLPHLYSRTVVDVFLDRNWSDFFEDSRDFLNCHNATSDLVVSAVCRELSVGSTVVLTGTEKCEQWLDINIGIGMSLMLGPIQLGQLGLQGAVSVETFALYKEDVTFIQLERETDRVLISLYMTQAPRIVPSGFSPFQLQRDSRPEYDVIIVISSRSDLARVDFALKNTFQDKYQLLLDVNSKLCLSPLRVCDKRRNKVAEGSRFLHPDKQRRYGHSGLMVLSGRRRQTFNSPSSASTSSLAQLHDKLKNLPLPPTPNSKIKKGVSSSPDLSVISESELSQHTQDSTTTLKIFPAQLELKSQSEGESKGYAKRKVKENSVSTRKDCGQKGAQSDPEGNKDRSVISHFPITVDSTDSLINQRTELNDKDLNTGHILDLLVQEAFQEKNDVENQQSDSGINMLCCKKTQDSEVIEDTQFSNFKAKNKKKQKPVYRKAISKSTSDESNTETLNEHQNFVTVRKRNLHKKSAKTDENDNATFDVKAVEDFFSQHFAENRMGEIVISPTIAKKINETSSESSNDCLVADIEHDYNANNEILPDTQIVECLNNIVDKVCTDLEKCAEYFRKYSPETEILNMATNMSVKQTESNILKDINNHDVQSKPPKSAKVKSKGSIKLKRNKYQKTTKKTKANLIFEPVSKMSTIIEDNNESDANKTFNLDDHKRDSTEVEGSFIKRKRKLYSPKDDHNNIHSDVHDDTHNIITEVNDEKKRVYDNIDDNDLKDAKVTPKRKSVSSSKSAATCYRDIEQDRQNYRNSRSRKLSNKGSPPSPKTKHINEVFEHLKDNIENNANIIIMDKKSAADAAVYNFTSDSEDEDFKQKKIDVQKRASTTTIGSGVSVMSTRRGRPVAKINYKEGNKSSSNETVTKPVRRKRVPKRKHIKNKAENVKVDSPILVDERMRDAPNEDLNSSFVEKPENTVKEPVPIIKRPQLENITNEHDAIEHHQEPVVKDKKKKPNKKHEPRLNIQPLEIVKDGERSVSPLPGLIIETDNRKNDREESVTTNLVDKFKKVLNEGPAAQDETNNTQQMLFDNDIENSSQMNITEEFGRMLDAENVLPESGTQHYIKHNDTSTNVIDDTICSDNETKKSTVGSTKSNLSKRNRLRLKSKESEKLNTKDFRLSSKDTNKKTEVLEINYSQKSKPIKSSIEEIILDEVRVTRSRSKSLSRLREIETIDISVMSENTIASANINAHGDMDESPPNTELLNEKMSPREIEDMNHTVKEYYIDLLEKVNVSKDSSKDLAKDQKIKTKSDLSSESISQLTLKFTKICDSDIAKYLPSVRNTESEASSHTSRESKSPSVCLKRLSAEDIAKWIPTQSIDESSIKSITKRILRSSPRKNGNRKSQISPIDLDDFTPKSMNSSDSKPNTSNTEDTDDKRTDFSKPFKFLKPARYSSPVFNVSNDFKELPSKLTSKRKSPAIDTEEREIKKRKLDVIYCKSSQSSTVDDWLKNLLDVSQGPKEDAPNEILANVMEKLDTTLVEIHRNTTKDFIGLFVEAQKKLCEMKEERRAAFRRTARDVLTAVTMHFDDLDRCAEERDDMFMSWLRQRATEALKKDCVRKQAMVAILRDDVDACTRAARD